jgi:membrane associated rhomboid family serine protease
MYYQTQRISPYVKGLIIANVAVFVMQMLPVVGDVVTAMGSLYPNATFLHWQLWRLASYMFLHSPDMIFHILFNMLALWWFGAELEDIWGGPKFLVFYFVCGIGAGLFSATYLLISPYVHIMGASGAVLGILTAYAIYYPTRQVLLFFIIPMKIRTIVIGYAVFSVLFSLRGGDNVAHLTHLGGIIVAWAYLKLFPMAQVAFGKWLYSIELKKRKAAAAKEANRKKHFEQRIDPILDKISKTGMQSLTPAEMKILKNASKNNRDLFRDKTIIPFV